jgi:allophanate hydrolase
MALANRLVGNASFEAALETTLTGASLAFRAEMTVAVTGATAKCTLNEESVRQHATINVGHGDVLSVGPAENGARSYVAFAGGLLADSVLGSSSTYLTAGFGGHEGRALLEGDELRLANAASMARPLQTPAEFRLPIVNTWTARAGRSCETASLRNPDRLFDQKFTVADRSDRMGIGLEGVKFEVDSDRQMPSTPLFPGIIQCPHDGSLYVMSVDSGTTGGYPRVAKIARMDLHLLGQLRPRSSLTLIERNDEDAARELQEKHAYWKAWLPDIAEVI